MKVCEFFLLPLNVSGGFPLNLSVTGAGCAIIGGGTSRIGGANTSGVCRATGVACCENTGVNGGGVGTLKPASTAS
jgi:hypothetical protein